MGDQVPFLAAFGSHGLKCFVNIYSTDNYRYIDAMYPIQGVPSILRVQE